MSAEIIQRLPLIHDLLFPSSYTYPIGSLYSTLPLRSIFMHDEVKPLADLIHRLTTMGVCYLLPGSKTSLAPAMCQCGVPKEVVGAVVEWQARCLEGGVWKGDGRGVLKRF